MHFHLQIHAHLGHRLPVSFESMVDELQMLAGMFIEQDGSFVWRDRRCDPPYQMDGMIYDRDGFVEYVDVQGPFGKHQWLAVCRIASGMPLDADPLQSDKENQVLEDRLRVNEPTTGRSTSVQSVVQLLTEV